MKTKSSYADSAEFDDQVNRGKAARSELPAIMTIIHADAYEYVSSHRYA